MAGRDVLRLLFAEGVRVVMREDGPRLIAEPGCEITPDVIELARQAKPEILPIVAELPAPGRCRICGWQGIWKSAEALCSVCACRANERNRPNVDAIIAEHQAAKAARGLAA